IYKGAVALYDLAPVLQEPGGFGSVVAADLLDPDYPFVLEGDRLSPTLPVFARVDGEWLPVTGEGRAYKGIVGKQDVLALYAQEVLGHPATLARIAPEPEGDASYVPLPEGFELREVPVTELLAGRTLVELELPQKWGIWILAIVSKDDAGKEKRVLA